MSNISENKINRRHSGSYAWGIRGFRPDTSTFMSRLRRRQNQSFTSKLTVAAETRWLALYCTDDDFTLQFVAKQIGIHRYKLSDLFNHYGLDIKTRNFRKETH